MSTLSTANITSKAATTPPVIKDSNGTEIGQFARAWVNFDGTGITINDSFNVASIVDQTGGEYDIVMTTAMPNANYAVAATTSIASNQFRGVFERRDGTTRSTTTFRITTGPHSASVSGVNAGEADNALMSVIVFGG